MIFPRSYGSGRQFRRNSRVVRTFAIRFSFSLSPLPPLSPSLSLSLSLSLSRFDSSTVRDPVAFRIVRVRLSAYFIILRAVSVSDFLSVLPFVARFFCAGEILYTLYDSPYFASSTEFFSVAPYNCSYVTRFFFPVLFYLFYLLTWFVFIFLRL